MSRNNRDLKHEAAPPGDSPENQWGIGNEERAEAALHGVLGFIDNCATDDCDAVADFLCDLRHLLDRMPATYGTWADNLRRAESHYGAEISPATGPLANPKSKPTKRKAKP